MTDFVTQDERIDDLEDVAYLKPRVTELEGTVNLLLIFISRQFPKKAGILRSKIKDDGTPPTHTKHVSNNCKHVLTPEQDIKRFLSAKPVLSQEVFEAGLNGMSENSIISAKLRR